VPLLLLSHATAVRYILAPISPLKLKSGRAAIAVTSPDDPAAKLLMSCMLLTTCVSVCEACE
jgi:hypothetical protein